MSQPTGFPVETGAGCEQNLADLLDFPVVMGNAQRRLCYLNRAAANLFAIDPGMPDGRTTALETLLAQAAGPFSLLLAAPDGERAYLAQLTELEAPADESPSLLLSFHDQTEQSHLARRLLETEDQIQAIRQAVRDAMIIVGANGLIRFANAATTTILGWSPAELIGTPASRLFGPSPPDQPGADPADSDDLLQAAERRELRLELRDGKRVDIELSASQFRNADSWATLLMLRDVTLRRDTENKLREAEARWQFALEGSGDAVWDWNIETGDILFSPRFKQMLGYADTEFEDSYAAWERAIHPDDLPRVRAQLKAYVEGAADTYLCEFRIRMASGAYMWIQDRGLIVERGQDGQPARMVGTQRDISAARQASESMQRQLIETLNLNRKLEETQLQLVQSEKLATIGQIAAGVAHEMNTPLGFVGSNFGSLERYANELLELLELFHAAARTGDPSALAAAESAYAGSDIAFMREDLPTLFSETREGLTRVQGIVRDLRDFSRVGEQQWQLADLHQGLDSTLNILRNQIKHKAQVMREYGELPALWCIPSQLNQVFLNLLANSLQAIRDPGTIRIRTAVENDCIMIRISDTGCGIKPGDLARIFDPFFTTKASGEGTGLGLSLSLDIVRKHHGRLYAESEPGVGSTFTVELPIAGQPEFAPDTP